MSVDQKIQGLITDAMMRLAEETALHLSLEVDSPIEQLMRGAFLARTIHTSHWLTMKYWPSGRPLDFDQIRAFRADNFLLWQICVWPQVTVGNYRVDFLAFVSLKGQDGEETDRTYLAIECDGHEFHEKTKEQAARDKARDRYLVGRHIPVMRFTGSEVWRAPDECVQEIVGYFEEKVTPEARVA